MQYIDLASEMWEAFYMNLLELNRLAINTTEWREGQIPSILSFYFSLG
jgi:hypothetical protein